MFNYYKILLKGKSMKKKIEFLSNLIINLNLKFSF